MVVISVSKCPASLKGDLTKWLFEIQTGVYVGNPSKRVREQLWSRILNTVEIGKATMVFNSRSEQGMTIRTHNTKQYPKNFDGVWLMVHPEKDSAAEGFPVNYSILDLETTGLNPENERIIEIGVIKVRDHKIDSKLQRLIKIDREIPKTIVQLTGLTNLKLERDGISIEEALAELVDFTGDDEIVGHNIGFDLSFVEQAGNHCNIPVRLYRSIDTIVLFRKVLPNLSNYKLQTVLDFLKIPYRQKHRAIEDCEAVYLAVEKMNKMLPLR